MDFGTIRRCEPFAGRILRSFGGGLLKVFRGFSDGVGHGDVNVVFWIVPIDIRSIVFAARRVDGDGVMLLECIDEVGGVVGGE